MTNQTTNKLSKNRIKKEGIVSELSQKVDKAKSIVFTNYQGLTHQQLERIKKTARKFEAEYVTTKNTLLQRTLEDKKIKLENNENLKEPTATLFIYNDIVAPIKALAAIIKELKLPKIKFGIFEGKIITEKEVNKIATLPPLPVLQAQLLGQMKAPISGLHRALNWNIQKLVLTLDAIKAKKS
jgi:large subunit ribosomal protein L10